MWHPGYAPLCCGSPAWPLQAAGLLVGGTSRDSGIAHWVLPPSEVGIDQDASDSDSEGAERDDECSRARKAEGDHEDDPDKDEDPATHAMRLDPRLLGGKRPRSADADQPVR